MTAFKKQLIDMISNGTLAGARQTRKPKRGRLLTFLIGPRGVVHIEVLAHDIFGTA